VVQFVESHDSRVTESPPTETVHYADDDLANAPVVSDKLLNDEAKQQIFASEHLVTPKDVVIDEARLDCLKNVKDEDRMPYIKAIAKEIHDVVRFGCFKLAVPPPSAKPLRSPRV